MAVITISRQTGSGGEQLAERLARRLDYRLVDKESLTPAAARAPVAEAEAAIRDLAERGQVILMGRGSQVILRDFPHVLHLRIVAGRQFRLAQLGRLRNLDEAAAAEIVDREDRRRDEYLRVNYRCDVNDPLLYDLVLRLDHLNPADLVEMIRHWVLEETVRHKNELDTRGP